MKKVKLEKGITLIALIITIVVLLILAAVTIGTIQKSKIIAHAQNAAIGYNKEKDNEVDALTSYETLIDENNPNVKKVNYDAIAQILTKAMNEGTAAEELVKQLKKELSIDDEDTTIMDLLINGIIDESIYYYFYKIDALYRLDFNTNIATYVEKDGNVELYAFGQNVKKVKTELENIFIGKNVSEMQEKYNAGILDEYILENSEKITVINNISIGEYISLYDITFVEDSYEFVLSDYTMYIYSREGNYYKVNSGYGT